MPSSDFAPLLLGPLFLLLLAAITAGQLMMKAKIGRQIDWGIQNGRIKLEVDGNPINKTKELYAIICSRDYPKK